MIITVTEACATTRARGWKYFDADEEIRTAAYPPINSFDNTKSLSGSQEGNQWKSQFMPILPEYPIRLNADLGSEYNITHINYVNSHDRGGETIWGFNHVRIYGAKDTPEGLAAYNEVRGKYYDGLTPLTNGTVEFVRHVDLQNNPNADIMNTPVTLFLDYPGLYRYYIFEIDDVFTSPQIWMGIRRIELLTPSSSSSSSSNSSESSSSSSSSTEIRSSSSTEIRSSSSSSSSSIIKTIRFGLVTDLHYADIADSPPRYYRDSLQKLTDAVNVFNNTNLDFVVCLGDFIDDAEISSSGSESSSEESDLDALIIINAIYENCIAPRKYLIGNRDMVRLTKSQFMTATGMANKYYSFDITNKGYTVHFVVLDCMYNSDGSDAEAGNFDVNDPIIWIPDAEETWLINDLNTNLNKPTYILAHYMISGASQPPPISISNFADIMSILENFCQVQAVFNGHLHANYYERVNGIHYVTFNAVVNNPYPTTAYATVEVGEDLSITVNGYGNQTSYNLNGRICPSSSSSSSNSP